MTIQVQEVQDRITECLLYYALLKLSIVEGKTRNIFDKIEQGIRILPIDEVAGLGENFDMLYEIAQGWIIKFSQ
jgi:hypothetical protein